MSPRRSSRARATANQPPLAHHSSSSSSSGSSTRGSSSRLQRHQDESLDQDTSFRDQSASVDTRNGHFSTPTATVTIETTELEAIEDDLDDTGSQEEEITRCICGHLEYQGEDDQTDTSEGLFIQCDKCHVWQHGFCVGITDKAIAPDNYFCERCRPELHKLVIRPHGPKSSLYLPLHAEASPTESSQGQKDMPTKRRSTMNSRDAAYDNAFELQRAIEESKSEIKSTRGSTRGRKRGTSEGSDEHKEYKRAKTSDSDSTTGTVDSGDEKLEKPVTTNSNKKGRNATARTNNTTTTTSKRPVRNRGVEKSKEPKREDPEVSDEFPTRSNGRNSKATATSSIPVEEIIPMAASEQPIPDTPQQTGKRNGRANNGNGGGRRRGNNNRNNNNNNNNNHRQSEDPNDESIASPNVMARNPSQSGHDRNSSNNLKDDANSTSYTNGTEKPSKSKAPQPKTSLIDMNRRVNSIMEFIQRTQLEMAIERQRAFLIKGNSPKVAKAITNDIVLTDAPAAMLNGTNTSVPHITINGTNEGSTTSDTANLHSTEIMDVLTRKLVHWQQTYGKMEKV